ncbi:hypothetical protein ACSNO4_14990, partial [Kocuria flava]
AGPAGGTPPHGRAPGGASPGGTSSGGAAPVAPPERSALFEDLPDGRPQYGIRLPQQAAPAEPGPGGPGAPRTQDGAGAQAVDPRGAGAHDGSAAEKPSGEDGPPAGGSTAAGPPR